LDQFNGASSRQERLLDEPPTLEGTSSRQERLLDGPPVLNVRLVKIETSEATKMPQGIENLDLHALSDLHQ
jgi:hypothetical protein